MEIEEPRFFKGLLWALALSAVLWALIFWVVA